MKVLQFHYYVPPEIKEDLCSKISHLKKTTRGQKLLNIIFCHPTPLKNRYTEIERKKARQN